MNFRNFTRTLLAAATVASGLAAQVTVKTILNNGSGDNRYDIVILGDGYRAAEQSKFDSDCAAVIAKLFQTEPYKTFEPFFNAHTVFRASNDSGADHPDATPPIVKDTVYDASYNTGGTARCLYIKNTSRALTDAAMAPAVEGRVMVVVNDTRYGGCAGTFAVTYNGSQMTNVQVHEFGHSFARLADEYQYNGQTYTGGEPAQKNITKDPTGATKWQQWLGYNGVAAFEGAGYNQFGLYRPKIDCMMRSLGRPMCEICAEQAVILGYTTVNAIDQPVPAQTTVLSPAGPTVSFSFTNLAPASSNSVIEWAVDGTPQASTTTTLNLNTTGLSFGNHTVRVRVQDQTNFVRNDPTNQLRSERTWTLQITPPNLPDLYALFLPATTGSANAGTSISVDTYVQNVGTQGSPTVRVDHFLSTDPVIDASDIYLGGYDQGALTPSSLLRTVRNPVTIPAHVAPGTYYVGMIIDRENAVNEIDETNNTASWQITIGNNGCATTLSYNNPLNYPSNAMTVAGAQGGRVLPVVRAPCNIGQGYLILLGCTGTSPGTTIGGVNLPLNLDACTNVFYPGSLALPGFFGTVNPAGNGIAVLDIPPGIQGTISGHFAAILFDKTSGAFTGATNPVEFVFQ